MNRFQFIARSLADTDRLGRVLAEEVPDRTVVALCGTLGAGKTRLVQAVASACGVPSELVVSPTFVLCQEYFGTRTICHLDAYRLRDVDEFRQLGPDEYFQSYSLTLIEWADRVRECLPAKRLELHIEIDDQDFRHVEIVGVGDRMGAVVQRISQRLNENPP